MIAKFKLIGKIFISAIFIFSLTSFGENLLIGLEKELGLMPRENIADYNELTITFLDVGKADCIFIESDYANIIIDGGTDYYEDDIYTYLLKRNIDEIDAIFISHFDYDHYTGLTEVLKNIKINVIYTNWDDNFPYNSRFEELTNEKEIKVEKLYYKDIINFGELKISILSPQKEYETSNEMSLVSKLEYKDFSALFTGDIENDAVDDLLNSGENINTDVMQIPHHGSKNGLSYEFLKAVEPNLAILSTGEYASNLPSVEVIKLLNENNVEYYQTYRDGNIIIATNGDSKITISTKEKTYEKSYN